MIGSIKMLNQIATLVKIFSFGTALMLMLAVFQLSHPQTVSAQVSCDTFATSSVCGQKSYDTCTLQYDGNRAFYDCKASQDPTRCTGKIYCGSLDKPFSGTFPSNINPATSQPVAPTCDSVNKANNFGTTTYDICEDNLGGSTQNGTLCRDGATKFQCHASQNDKCTSGGFVYSCPVAAAPAAPATSANSTATVTCPAGTTPGQNSQGVTVCVANASSSNSTGGTAVATATGGAGGSANVNLTGVAPATVSQPAQVSGVSYVKQLPNTGLPGIALAGLGLLPLGTGLKGFRKGWKALKSNDPSFIWENRQFKSQF